MKKILFVCLALTALASLSAFASETSTAPQSLEHSYVNREMLGIRPALGFAEFTDADNGRSTRMGAGFTVDFNSAQIWNVAPAHWTLGFQSGLQFYHVGEVTSGIFGAGTATTDHAQANANLVIVPLNLKMGYSVSDDVRLSLHAGANLFYRSNVAAVQLNDEANSWQLMPNLGADFEFTISQNLLINIRPDWTIAGSRSMGSGLVAFGFEM